jgi:site-specific DNA recombinase
MLRDFAKQGITLVSASGESPDPLYQKLAGVLAWDESRRISIRTSGSKMKRHTEGKWNGKPVFGYGLEKHPEGGSYLVPNEQSPLVTEMFTRYASGKCSLMDLRDFLNEAGIKKSRYSIWYIIKNPVYLGLLPHGLNDRSPFKPKAELHWTEGKHQPLTDQDTFGRVQTRLTDNKSRQKGEPAAKYLFSGLVYCGNCGAKYQARTFKRRGSKVYVDYRCNRKHGFGDCQASSVLESHIRDAVVPPIEKLISKLSQDDVRAAVRAELVRQQEDTMAADQVTKMGAADTLERLEARLSSLEDAFLDGDIAKDRYRARRDELAGQIKELQAQLATRPHMALPDVDQLFALADALEGEPPDDQEWREIIEGMVDRIIIEGRNIRVVWKDAFQPLMEAVSES